MRPNSTMTRCRTVALLACAVGVAACGDKMEQNITAPVNGALVQFFNFGVGAPGVNFYENTLKVTGVSSSNCAPPNDTTSTCRSSGAESTTGTTYGNAADGALYSQLTPGTVALAGKITATTDNGLAISTLNTTLAANTMYSYYLSGIYDPVAKTSDSFVVTDSLPTPDLQNTYVRFVNAISNSQPMTLYVKLQSSGVETAAGTTTQAYKAAGAFILLPPGVYDLNTRTAGSSTNVISRTSVSFVAGHVYTVTARGDMTSGVTANKPALDNTANR
jgi:hypothetical protein